MEWNTKEYSKLIKEYERKYKALSNERFKSSCERHSLYSKGSNMTPEDENKIEANCEYEDGIIETLNDLEKLKDNVFKSLDELNERLNYI